MEEILDIVQKKIYIYQSLVDVNKHLAKFNDLEYYEKSLAKLKKCKNILTQETDD